MEFKTAYGPKPAVRSGPFPKSRTKQSMAAECDINYIVEKYQKTGLVQHANTYKGEYANADNISFHEAMNIVIDARTMFETVPANIRKKFDNDPGKFLAFVQNEENRAEAIEIGIIPKPETTPEAMEAPPPSPPAEPAPGAAPTVTS